MISRSQLVFPTLLKSKIMIYYYVDKTRLIADLLEKETAEVTSSPAPAVSERPWA